MEHDSPRQLPKSDWLILAEICQEKGIDMKIMVYPEKYRDDVSCSDRARTLQEAARRGIRIQSMSSLCPMSERSLRRIMNGIGECLELRGASEDQAPEYER
jgi:hypothetical protein